jgi:hypothetical protein
MHSSSTLLPRIPPTPLPHSQSLPSPNCIIFCILWGWLIGFHKWVRTWYLSFHVWLIFTQYNVLQVFDIVNDRISFFVWLRSIPLCKYSTYSLSIHLPKGILDWLYMLAITNSAAINKGAQVIFSIYFLSFQYIPSSEIAGSHDISVFSLFWGISILFFIMAVLIFFSFFFWWLLGFEGPQTC